MTNEKFAAVRRRVLSASPAVSSAESAHKHVEARERAPIAEAKAASAPREPKTPAGFRSKKSRPPEEPAAPAAYRVKKARGRKEEKKT